MSAAGGPKDTVKKKEVNTKGTRTSCVSIATKVCARTRLESTLRTIIKTVGRKERRHVSNTLQQELLALESLDLYRRRMKKWMKRMIGLNVFRERYEGIKWSKSRLCFEKDKPTSKLNGADVGGTNHSRKFSKKIGDNVYEIMQKDMRKNMDIN